MANRAKSNPIPITVCGDIEYIYHCKQTAAEDYKFYAKVLRTIYSKVKLRNRIIDIMHGIENTRYYKVPD